ncbi:MAG TPA: hypothetical protein VFY69_04025 [Solirubrobacterales bacterium]|nr:hypothetical protein [Solirubrobacterales bacterium]
MLAVLAMACVPGLAQAENSELQYEPDVPVVPEHEKSKDRSDNSGGSDDRSEPDAGTSGSGPTGGGSGGNDGSNSGGGANTGQSNQGAGGGDGKAATGDERAGGKLDGAKPISSIDEAAAPASDDGGSSPLVPILIAIAVLAAISVGAFLYRQRRQDPTSISPKAS